MDDMTQKQRLRENLTLQRLQHVAKLQDDLYAQETDRQSYEEKQESKIRYYRMDDPENSLVRSMPTGNEAPDPAPVPAQAVKVSRMDQKKRDSLEKQAVKAVDELHKTEARLADERWMNLQISTEAFSDKQEKEVLNAKLKAITASEELSLKDAKLTKATRSKEQQEIMEREIRWRAQSSRAKAYGRYARALPVETEARAWAMKKKEHEELAANKLRKAYKVSTIVDSPDERAREEDTISRHGHYDRLKLLFRKYNPLSREDAGCSNPENGHELINVGRAFMGGTKAMYVFEDKEDQSGKQYLFKEATNCIGINKPEGAMVTEAASKLQRKLYPTRSIPAFAVKDKKGRVLGSIQEKVELKQNDTGVNLFSWQASPELKDVIPVREKKEILENHTLDWLLCNFDTKGENFLRREDGHLVSFDKEASFNQIFNEEARDMSMTFKPHAADTLYNVMFRQYAAGRMTLDLRGVEEQIKRVEEMGDEEYITMFEDMLKQKFDTGLFGKNAEKQRMRDAILERKTTLREKYVAFFTMLVTERSKALKDADQKDDTEGLVDTDGRFTFDKAEAANQ